MHTLTRILDLRYCTGIHPERVRVCDGFAVQKENTFEYNYLGKSEAKPCDMVFVPTIIHNA